MFFFLSQEVKVSDGETINVYCCDFCDKTFINVTALTAHRLCIELSEDSGIEKECLKKKHFLLQVAAHETFQVRYM
jgi:hypothetical protein